MCKGDLGRGQGSSLWKLHLEHAWEPAGCLGAGKRIYLCELEQNPDLGRWGAGRNSTAARG